MINCAAKTPSPSPLAYLAWHYLSSEIHLPSGAFSTSVGLSLIHYCPGGLKLVNPGKQQAEGSLPQEGIRSKDTTQSHRIQFQCNGPLTMLQRKKPLAKPALLGILQRLSPGQQKAGCVQPPSALTKDCPAWTHVSGGDRVPWLAEGDVHSE